MNTVLTNKRNTTSISEAIPYWIIITEYEIITNGLFVQALDPTSGIMILINNNLVPILIGVASLITVILVVQLALLLKPNKDSTKKKKSKAKKQH